MLLGPFHFENQMIIAETGDTFDGFLRVFLVVESDESEAFRGVVGLVFGEKDTTDLTKWNEQITKILFLSLFGKIGHSNCRFI